MSNVLLKKISEQEIQERSIRQWPVWEKEISRFPWTYTDTEECLIIEGEFMVETANGTYKVEAGDFIVFEKGLNCIWDIKKDVKKHYNFI
jgi:uncharacterized protein